MANSLKRPFIIDTASATPVFTDAFRVIYVKWVGATTPGHSAIIQDPAGNVLWEGLCPGANYDSGPQRIERWWNTGFAVTTLQSGRLYIDWA